MSAPDTDLNLIRGTITVIDTRQDITIVIHKRTVTLLKIRFSIGRLAMSAPDTDFNQI